MNTMTLRQSPLSHHEAALARASQQFLSRYASSEGPLKLLVADDDQAEPIELPASAVTLLKDRLGAMATGQTVLIFGKDAELNTIQAANMLNVSRPFLIKLLDERKITHRKVGRHRRIRMEDVLTYKESDDAERERLLDLLAAEAQEQDMGYGKQ